jgi:hypothetical protein
MPNGTNKGGGNTPPFDLSKFLNSPYTITYIINVDPFIQDSLWSLRDTSWVYDDQEVMDAIDEMLNNSEDFPLGEELIQGVINGKSFNRDD